MNIKFQNLKNKKVLVTGGLGFIGSHLIRILIKKYNCQILNIDSKSYCSMPEALNDIKITKYYKIYYDISSICFFSKWGNLF